MNLDASKSAGALVGTYAAELICASLTYFAHIPISGQTEAAVTGLCIFLAAHFFPSTKAIP
jgi:hypothetical protein